MNRNLKYRNLIDRTYGRGRFGRIAALLSVIILLLMLFFSMFFIAAEAGHHDCTGENCPICATVEICINTIKNISNLKVAATASIAVMVYIIQKNLFTVSEVVKSPVLERVRLNN